jgi:uncharacterized zinc-type alcohol dehydrogenase-like protein
VRGEWAGTLYPCVPGHEIVGRVSSVGDHVHNYKVGDLVGVGCMVDSCQHCADCEDGLENYCDGMVGTYNGATADAPGHTLGGYSEQIVVHERFVLRVTTPGRAAGRGGAAAVRRHHHVFAAAPLERRSRQDGRHRRHRRPGHMGIKLARAMGAHVVAFTTSCRSAGCGSAGRA